MRLLLALMCVCGAVMVPGRGSHPERKASPPLPGQPPRASELPTAPVQEPPAAGVPTVQFIPRPKLDELIAKLKQLKEPVPLPHDKLEHPAVPEKPTDQDKHTNPELRLSHLVDAIVAFQAQHLVLGSAVHSILQKLQMENDQFVDQQAVLASSFEALFNNVASRQDLEEITIAAGEDNTVHVDLEDASRKLEDMMNHLHEIKGGEHVTEGAAVEAEWKRMSATIADSSLSKELINMKRIVETLQKYRKMQDNSLFYFVLLNVCIVAVLLTWWSRAKTSLSYR